MSDISSFPDMTEVLAAGDNLQTFKAAETIKPGQVVAFNAGEPGEVVVADQTDGEFTAGVAIFGGESGDMVTVAGYGTICYVANADDTTTIDAGDPVEQDDNSVGGTVATIPTGDTGGATVTVHNNGAGFAIDDIAGGGTGRIIVMPVVIVQPNAS